MKEISENGNLHNYILSINLTPSEYDDWIVKTFRLINVIYMKKLFLKLFIDGCKTQLFLNGVRVFNELIIFIDI